MNFTSLSLFGLTLCLALGAAQAAEAQIDFNELPPPPPTVDEAPRLALGTTLGGLAGVGAGFGLAWAPALASLNNCSPDEDFCGFGAVIYVSVSTWATPATTALGIWSGGRAAGGRGNYGLTLLGSALGGTLGGGLAALSSAGESNAAAIAGFISIPVLEWVGGVIAYHLSHNASERRLREPRMIPVVQVESGGASLGLAGAF